MPIDFSEASENFNGFSGSGFSFNTDPIDSGNDVGQFFNDGTASWQGFYLDLSRPIDLDFQKTITLSFYSFDPNTHKILLKLENGINADVEVLQTVSFSGWTHNIMFDFSNAVYSSDGSPTDATGTYNRLTIFVDGGSMTAGTYLIDDIDDGSTPVDPYAIDIEYSDLVWSDEFDSTTPEAIDPSKWHHQTVLPRDYSFFPNHDNHALCCWFNGEEQHYTDRIENSYMENGFLSIVAIKESFTNQNQTKQYTSARLNSKFAFTYGRVDVRAKLPVGDGTWPAIWTLGKNVDEFGNFWHDNFGTTAWPACGEIDIMEHGLGAVNHTSSAIHTPSSFGGTVNTKSQLLSDVTNNFHVYSVNWSPNQITFLVDGVGYYTYNPAVKDANTWPFDNDQYIILNVAMGGIAGTIDSGFTQSAMEIDYVRVYQNNSLNIAEVSANNFKVFPNPASDYVFIDSKIKIDKIMLYDVVGNLILKEFESFKRINVSSLNAGIYLMNIHSDGEKTTKKIIIN